MQRPDLGTWNQTHVEPMHERRQHNSSFLKGEGSPDTAARTDTEWQIGKSRNMTPCFRHKPGRVEYVPPLPVQLMPMQHIWRNHDQRSWLDRDRAERIALLCHPAECGDRWVDAALLPPQPLSSRSSGRPAPQSIRLTPRRFLLHPRTPLGRLGEQEDRPRQRIRSRLVSSGQEGEYVGPDSARLIGCPVEGSSAPNSSVRRSFGASSFRAGRIALSICRLHARD